MSMNMGNVRTDANHWSFSAGKLGLSGPPATTMALHGASVDVPQALGTLPSSVYDATKQMTHTYGQRTSIQSPAHNPILWAWVATIVGAWIIGHVAQLSIRR